MLGPVRNHAPYRGARARKARPMLDVILHLGAHRCATTSLQTYLDRNSAELARHRVAVWIPSRTRTGLFSGLTHDPNLITADVARRSARSTALIGMEMQRLERSGFGQLVVSDENLLGGMRQNLTTARLYPDVLPRLLRLRAALASRLSRIVLTVRSYENYWASLIAYQVTRGHALPDTTTLDRLVTSPRGWRHVIGDLRAAYPSTDIAIWAHERVLGRPDEALAYMLGGSLIGAHLVPHAGAFNASLKLPALRTVLAARGQDPAELPDGNGRWMPFSDAQQQTLAARYADDIAWLRNGADGLARWIENAPGARPGSKTLTGQWTTDGPGPFPPPQIGGRENGKQRYLV